MLDHVLGYIALGSVPLPLPNHHLSSLKGREILVDLADLLLDILGVCLEIDGHGRTQIIAHFIARENHRKYKCLKEWSEWQDLNLRPLRPERK
jgi:hypothetical protein